MPGPVTYSATIGSPSGRLCLETFRHPPPCTRPLCPRQAVPVRLRFTPGVAWRGFPRWRVGFPRRARILASLLFGDDLGVSISGCTTFEKPSPASSRESQPEDSFLCSLFCSSTSSDKALSRPKFESGANSSACGSQGPEAGGTHRAGNLGVLSQILSPVCASLRLSIPEYYPSIINW